MSSSFNISIVGSGNLASGLAPELENAGHIIHSISSLHLENAEALAAKLYNSEAIDHLNFSEADLDIILLAVNDDRVASVCRDIETSPKTIIAHCSGFLDLDSLSDSDQPTGVFYPLQSFSKGRRVNLSSVPICVESYDPTAEKKLLTLAKSVSKHVAFVDSPSRKKLHLAAVFANNFVNHMMATSREILEDTNLDVNLFKPLLEETIAKVFALGPNKAQTGPAKRGDIETIQAHLDMLEDQPDIAALYEMISKQIMSKY